MRRFPMLDAIGLALLVAACGWSLWRVLGIRREAAAPGVRTVRIAHWQLEVGFREALQAVIDDYNRLNAHRGVRVVQVPVTEKIYPQWLNVNLIADNAPDLAELGQAKLASAGESLAKYFLPLGREIAQPNPWNAPEHLDEIALEDPAARAALAARLSTAPWRETLLDGMQGGWRPELQDYYSVPTSFFTVRVFYNKDLLRAALGSDEPPRTLDALFAACERLRAWARANGVARFDPIAGTRYHRTIFTDAYRIPFTAGYRDALDLDLSGDLSSLESWAGFQSGRARMGDAPIRDYHLAMRDLCAQFNRNFAAMDRDQAIAAFAQGRTAMMASGSWDAGSVFAGARDVAVGVTAFPLPAPGGRYGRYGPWGGNEAGANGGAAFGIVKSSRHPDVALDFLRFLTSHKWNQRHNRANAWLPVVIGATPDAAMAPFMPDPYGLMERIAWTQGFDLETRWNGLLDRWLGRESDLLDYDAFARRAEALIADPAIGVDRVWARHLEQQRDNVRALERTIAVHTFRALAGTGDEGTAARVRETILDQALLNDGGAVRALHRAANGRDLPEAP